MVIELLFYVFDWVLVLVVFVIFRVIVFVVEFLMNVCIG